MTSHVTIVVAQGTTRHRGYPPFPAGDRRCDPDDPTRPDPEVGAINESADVRFCARASHLLRSGLVDAERPNAENRLMTHREIDEYLAALDEPKRSTLQDLRRTIIGVIPEAEECISYGLPAFRMRGKVVAGFGAFKNHLSYFPHSGSVLPELSEDLAGYDGSKGTLQFGIDTPLPKPLVEKLIAVRLRQLPQG